MKSVQLDFARAQNLMTFEQEEPMRALIVCSCHTVLKSHALAYSRIGWMMA